MMFEEPETEKDGKRASTQDVEEEVALGVSID